MTNSFCVKSLFCKFTLSVVASTFQLETHWSNMQLVKDQHDILPHWKANTLDVLRISLYYSCKRKGTLEKKSLTAACPYIFHLSSSCSTIALLRRGERSSWTTSDEMFKKINILFLITACHCKHYHLSESVLLCLVSSKGVKGKCDTWLWKIDIHREITQANQNYYN